MELYLLKSFKAVKEIIRSGEIQCTAEGEKICIRLSGNISGDVLVFIGPKTKISTGENIMDLIQSDTRLEEQSKVVFKTFRLRMEGLTALPNRLIWLINIVLSTFILSHYAEPIFSAFTRNDPVAGIIQSLPVIILTGITVRFGKTLGLKLMKPLFSVITRIIRFVRRMRNRKVSESHV